MLVEGNSRTTVDITFRGQTLVDLLGTRWVLLYRIALLDCAQYELYHFRHRNIGVLPWHFGLNILELAYQCDDWHSALKLTFEFKGIMPMCKAGVSPAAVSEHF